MKVGIGHARFPGCPHWRREDVKVASVVVVLTIMASPMVVFIFGCIPEPGQHARLFLRDRAQESRLEAERRQHRWCDLRGSDAAIHGALGEPGLGHEQRHVAIVGREAAVFHVGRSRFAIVSATSSSAAVVGAAALATTIAPGQRAVFAAGLVVATGLVFLFAAAARLGALSNFIAKPVLRGFSFGLAVAIVIKQLPKMTGFHPSTDFLPVFSVDLVRALSAWHWTGVSMGVGALLLLKLLSRFRRVPGALLVIALGIAGGQWLNAHGHAVEFVGPLTLGLSEPAIPVLTRDQWLSAFELSLALLLLLFAESYGAIRGMALKHGDEISPNRDLAALGIANLLSGLFRGMPVGAGYSATSANEAAGAQTRFAAWIAAAVVALLLALFVPLIEMTPEAVLAAIVIHAVSHTLTLDAFRPYFRWKRDRIVVVCSALAVILLGVLNGLLAGTGISLVMMLRGFSDPRVSELGRQGRGHDFLALAAHPDVSRVPGLLVLRPEEPLFFANVERVLVQMRPRILAAEPRGVVISLEESPDLDGTSVEAIGALAQEQLRSGVRLAFARLKDPVFALLQSTITASGEVMLFAGSVDDAVDALLIGADDTLPSRH